MYTDIAIDHFTNPRNVGSMEDADGIGMAGDPECGDYLKIFLKVEDDFITDIKFQVHGCAGAISTSSMTTEMAKGLPIMAAFAITEQDIVNKLGGLPEEKIHCSLLGAMALKKAIVDYAQNRKK